MLSKATSEENWNAPTKLLQELAEKTNKSEERVVICNFIFKRLSEKDFPWKRVIKILNLTAYLARYGNIRIVEDLNEKIEVIRKYLDYEVKVEGERTSAVKDVALVVVNLLTDSTMLEEERKTCQRIKETVDFSGYGTSKPDEDDDDKPKFSIQNFFKRSEDRKSFTDKNDDENDYKDSWKSVNDNNEFKSAWKKSDDNKDTKSSSKTSNETQESGSFWKTNEGNSGKKEETEFKSSWNADKKKIFSENTQEKQSPEKPKPKNLVNLLDDDETQTTKNNSYNQQKTSSADSWNDWSFGKNNKENNKFTDFGNQTNYKEKNSNNSSNDIWNQLSTNSNTNLSQQN